MTNTEELIDPVSIDVLARDADAHAEVAEALEDVRARFTIQVRDLGHEGDDYFTAGWPFRHQVRMSRTDALEFSELIADRVAATAFRIQH